MLTRDERRALLFLAGTAALGGAVRAVRAGADSPPGAALVAPELPAGDVAAQAARAQRSLALARALQPGERVDVDRADAVELERLARVGPELARRIVDERTARGPFGSLEALGRVPGMGPATLRGLERQVSFSEVPAQHAPTAQEARDAQDAPDAQDLQSARAAPAAQRPGPAIATMPPPPPPKRIGGITVALPKVRRPRVRRADAAAAVVCPALPLSINVASSAELACLPGIGPALAERIVTWRTEHGPFAEVKDLERVPGIGPGRLQRLLPYIRAP